MAVSSNIVLGIDPGSRITGFGFIRQEGTRLIHVHSGIIDCLDEPTLERRLKKIQDELTQLIQTYKPNSVAMEGIFFAKNVKSAVTLAHARGVAMCTAAQFNLTVQEYKPTQVKEAIVGYGKATKEQIQDMVVRLLNLSKSQVVELDQTDALAIAICHTHTDQIQRKISQYNVKHV
ncbi:MAG: crossover junction endodeoxyribonuclease RuvC [Proteobacteria bacterium]|jgi:crossover junction endodeoxyribonuclease RuvC|nr:crossover junction endodeoxyribonuclease RuvC [Pseudomonadota bacterium]